MFSPEGHSIRCFECNSNTDPRCAEKIVPAYLSVDCSKTPEAEKGTEHTICRKTSQFIEIPVNGSKCQRVTKIQCFRFIAFIFYCHSERRGTCDSIVRLGWQQIDTKLPHEVWLRWTPRCVLVHIRLLQRLHHNRRLSSNSGNLLINGHHFQLLYPKMNFAFHCC